jgi:hypothetical protein
VTLTHRFELLLAVVSATALAVGRAEAASSASAPASLPPGIAALLAQPAWSRTFTVHAGVGYKDNVLLSRSGEERSAFLRGGFDTMLWHVPSVPGGSDYLVFLGGEGTRYFSSASVDHELQAFFRTQWRRRFGDSLKLTLDGIGYYNDAIFDVSDTDVRRVVAELKVAGATVGPILHWDATPAWWIEAQAMGKRERDRDSAISNYTGDGSFRVGWHRGERVEISAAAMERLRDFDHRDQFSAAGRELTDTHLKVREQEGEGRIVIGWDQAAHWKTTTRLGVLHYTDNGSGYFNYHRRSVGQMIEWSRGPWLISAEGSAKRLEYEVQTEGFGLTPPPLVKDEFNVDVDVERKVSTRWTLVAHYGWERRRSNDPIAPYVVNESLLGVRWSWPQ